MAERTDEEKKLLRRLDRLQPRGVKARVQRTASLEQLSEEKELQMVAAKAGGMTKEAAETMMQMPVPNVSRVPLLYVDPMFDPILLMFPKENRRELNRRLRHYYEYHPIVRNVIDLHSEIPLSDLELRCEDKGIERAYNKFKEKINLLELCVFALKDYWLLGESFFYGNWDKSNLEWSSFNQYPPEDVDIFNTYVTSDGVAYFLKPTEDIKKIITSTKAVDQAIVGQMPPDFVEAMRANKPYMLDNARVLNFSRKPAKYVLRGEGILKSCLKDLLFEDKLRLLQYTFVDRHMFPIKLWKLGSKEKGWIPSKKHFDRFEQLLVQAANDPDFNIIYHPFVEPVFLGVQDKIHDLKAEFEFVKQRILIGLFANEGLIHGEAPAYAQQAVSMRILTHRYLTVRALLEHILIEKVFLPMARERDYVKKPKEKGEKKEYILPKFFWQKLNLVSNTTVQEFILRLRERGEIPFEIVADVFGWDTETVKDKFKEEESTCLDPLWKTARESAAEDEKVRNQILEGTKTKELVIEEKEEKVKLPPKPVSEEVAVPKEPEEEPPKEIGSEEGAAI